MPSKYSRYFSSRTPETPAVRRSAISSRTRGEVVDQGLVAGQEVDRRDAGDPVPEGGRRRLGLAQVQALATQFRGALDISHGLAQGVVVERPPRLGLQERDELTQLVGYVAGGRLPFLALQVPGVGLVAPQEGVRDVEDRQLLAEHPEGDPVPLLAGAAAGVVVDEEVGRRQPGGQLPGVVHPDDAAALAFGRLESQHRAAQVRPGVGAQLGVVPVLGAGQLSRTLEPLSGKPRRERLAVAPGQAGRLEERVQGSAVVPDDLLALLPGREQIVPVVRDQLAARAGDRQPVGPVLGGVHGRFLPRSGVRRTPAACAGRARPAPRRGSGTTRPAGPRARFPAAAGGCPPRPGPCGARGSRACAARRTWAAGG